MRIISCSMIAGVLLFGSGCSVGSKSDDGQSRGVVHSEPAHLVGEVDLPKDATVDSIPALLKSGGMSWDDFGGESPWKGPSLKVLRPLVVRWSLSKTRSAQRRG